MQPASPSILYYLSLVYEDSGKYDEAESALRQVISMEPSNINAFLHLAYVYGKQHRGDDVIKTYEEILVFEKEKPEIYQYYANSLIQLKRYEKAEAVLKDACARFPDNDELLFLYAVLCEKTGRFDEMVQYLEKAITINPKNAEALNYLGYSFADKNVRLEEALNLIQRALEIKPGNAYYIDSLGWTYFRMGKYDKAVEALKKAVDIAGDDPTLHEHLGDIYVAMGQRDKALDAWKTSLKFHEKEDGLKERVEKKISGLAPAPK
jgi:tetratricopeptide (TPR) repeat protein